MAKQEGGWATMTPRQHVEAAEVAAGEGRTHIAALHLQAAQVGIMDRGFSLFASRVQYVDTRGLR